MKCEYCGTVSLDNRHNFVHATRDFEAELNHYLENAEALMSDGEYNIAFNQFGEIAVKFSKYYRGWWGMVRAITQEFTVTDISEENSKVLGRYYKNAKSKAPDDKEAEIEAKYNEYKAAVEKVIRISIKCLKRLNAKKSW